MKKIKNSTEVKSLLKVGDWLFLINKEYKERKWLFEILLITGNQVRSNGYRMFEGQNLEKEENGDSNPENWDFKYWNWYKLNEKEIVKWKKIILLELL